jgi:hypothetical protein
VRSIALRCEKNILAASYIAELLHGQDQSATLGFRQTSTLLRLLTLHCGCLPSPLIRSELPSFLLGSRRGATAAPRAEIGRDRSEFPSLSVRR